MKEFNSSKLCFFGFASFFLRFAGLDALIQCMSTTTLLLSNQTFYWSNVAP